MKKILSLCEGRHQMPAEVTGSIFSNELNPLDVDGIKATADSVLAEIEGGELILYVTGLSVALAAVIAVCVERNIRLTLMHFNRESGAYYPQTVLL